MLTRSDLEGLAIEWSERVPAELRGPINIQVREGLRDAAPTLALAAIDAGVLLEELRHECVMSGGESGLFVEVLNKLDAALAQAGVSEATPGGLADGGGFGDRP